MIFDVQTILKTEGARANVQVSLLPPEEFSGGEIEFCGELSFSGVIENVGGVLELSGEAKGSFAVPCARCMKITTQHYCVAISETYAHENAEGVDLEAVLTFVGTSIDLGEAIWPNVLLSIDTKYLCQPSCKGLCPMCGADLNETSCDCAEDEIDPRLAGLADLLK
ncbi:MAG: DUF177 domain-containing protein [Clostridia bacterium]|nr:DUF177 domain-containing protein [Clostridia bacterium]